MRMVVSGIAASAAQAVVTGLNAVNVLIAARVRSAATVCSAPSVPTGETVRPVATALRAKSVERAANGPSRIVLVENRLLARQRLEIVRPVRVASAASVVPRVTGLNAVIAKAVVAASAVSRVAVPSATSLRANADLANALAVKEVASLRAKASASQP